MKISEANRNLNIAGGLVLAFIGVVGWGVAAWAALTPLPPEVLPPGVPTPDVGVCRSHATDIGFTDRFVPPRDKPTAYAAAPGTVTVVIQHGDGVDAEVLLEKTAALVTRCAMSLDYFCAGDKCTETEGYFMKAVLAPKLPVQGL